MTMQSAPMPFRFGCQVYSWYMNGRGQTYRNRLDHIIAVAARAGFAGIEPLHFWMGDLSDPARLEACLQRHGITLAAVALLLEWNGEEETAVERAESDAVIDLLARYPGTTLCAAQVSQGRFEVRERQTRLVRNLNAVAARAADCGVACAFHPSSPPRSITRSAEDYAAVLNGLDRRVIGWAPDVGHIVNGGMDPLTTMREYAELIRLVHFKDWDGAPEWAVMGRGQIDFAAITRWLRDRQFGGWIVCEDEGQEAEHDPDGVMLKDGAWLREVLIPAL
jgi:inosose dehydratase